MAVYWDISHEIPMSTPLHAAAPPLAVTGCCCQGSPAIKLDTGASRNRSNYQGSPQFSVLFIFHLSWWRFGLISLQRGFVWLKKGYIKDIMDLSKSVW